MFLSFIRYRNREPYTEIEGDNNETPEPVPATSTPPASEAEDEVLT